MRLHHLAAPLDGQNAPMIGERVNQYRGVFARLDDFVEITDRARLHRAGQRAVEPAGFLAFEQVAAD